MTISKKFNNLNLMSSFKNNPWFLFFGILLTLIGVFLSLRVAFNFVYYTNYPVYGALPVSFTAVYPSLQTEADCLAPKTYYGPGGEISASPSADQVMQAKNDEDSCLRSVSEQRLSSKTSDIAQTAFFLFLGLGILGIRKFLK